jgi:8-oxo-dGTP diphosphatase
MPSDGVAAMKRSWLHEEIRRLVAELAPVDTVEEEHRRRVLAWLERTRDVFRRVRPCMPSPHLVSYFLLTDLGQGSVLLVDHRKAGLWLPTGGHVEPGEHPAATVRREAREELGIEAVLSPVTGEKPLFVTITQTAQVAGRHTDVSLWYVLSYGTSEPLTPDPGEFREARWWTRAQINHADPALFDPHMNRMLDKLDRAHTASAGRAARPKT